MISWLASQGKDKFMWAPAQLENKKSDKQAKEASKLLCIDLCFITACKPDRRGSIKLNGPTQLISYNSFLHFGLLTGSPTPQRLDISVKLPKSEGKKHSVKR